MTMTNSKSSGSLTRRLILSAALIMFLFLGLTGVALDRAFVNSQYAGQSERLFIRVFGLVSLVEVQSDTLILPRALQDERFNRPESGLVAIVIDSARQPVWESLSSEWFVEGDWLRGLENLPEGVEDEFGTHNGWAYQRNGFYWETIKDNVEYFEFWVLESAEPLNSSIQTFRGQLWGGLIAVTIAMLVVMFLLTAWGLAPLRRLATNLNLIRSGHADRLTGQYPTEILPLTDSLNQLLQAEQGQRERYRKAMADLAHSLKTPLAVVRALSSDKNHDVTEQVQRMDQIIRYQLQRAVTDARSGAVLSQRSDIREALTRLSRALEKAFAHEDKALELPEDETPVFVSMDSNDVLEVLGNLLENGFKYSRSLIMVSIENAEPTSNHVLIHIDDDGEGITDEQSKEVLTRGKRLDTMQPGQGIGLAMVNDILESYDISLFIGRSSFGGARFTLKLPMASSVSR